MKRKKLHSKSLLAFMFLCIFIMCASVTVSAGTNILPSVKQAKAGTWQRDENGNKYVYTDGRSPKSCWLKIAGKYYSFIPRDMPKQDGRLITEKHISSLNPNPEMANL